ncbi:MAG: HlyD family secretion protein [Chitinophagales bacterium]
MENITTQEQQPEKKKSILFPIILGIVILAGGFFGYKEYVHGQSHEKTDNAQVMSNMTPIISRVSGYINEVKVTDNQFVHKGDTLLILDNRDQKMLLAQTEAAFITAQNNISVAKLSANAASKNINTSNTAVHIADAQIDLAKVNVWKTTQDFNRYANLIKDHSITQQQYEQAVAAKEAAEKQLKVLMDQKNQVKQQIDVVVSQTQTANQQISTADAMLKQRMVDVENAKLNLSYTVITAPEDGFVSKVPVQNGQLIQAGMQLFSLIKDNDVWIVANFKETQIPKMLEGQKVEIEIDAFPKQKFEGIVSSFSPGTGSSFSVLPPDNASGNFVKVVQRVPVRIDFKNLDNAIAKKMRVGLNATVEVMLK